MQKTADKMGAQSTKGANERRQDIQVNISSFLPIKTEQFHFLLLCDLFLLQWQSHPYKISQLKSDTCTLCCVQVHFVELHNFILEWCLRAEQPGRVLTAPGNGLISNTFSVESWIMN